MSQNYYRTYFLNSVLFTTLVHLLLTIQNGDCQVPRESMLMLSPGTTKYLVEIFTGRCNDYVDCTTLPHPFQCETNPGIDSINCTASLYEFLDAFADVDQCNVSDDAYDLLLQNDMVHSEPDETLFWSGTKDIAVNIATVTSKYTSIERTVAGYILNNLMWCGQANSGQGVYPAEENMMCPKCPMGQPSATFQFWRSASRHFAAQAQGYVTLLLDSTRKNGAFQNTSTFAREELPNINPEQVNHVYIRLVRNVSAPANTSRETCGTGSILVLRSLLEQKGLNYTCTEDDTEFLLIQCVEYQDALPCKGFFSSSISLSSLHLSLTSTILLALSPHLLLSSSSVI